MATWTDYRGREWHVTTSPRRLKFKIPCHAALRAHVFHRDGYRCLWCGIRAEKVPLGYDGHDGLFTTAVDADGWGVQLVIDHVLTRAAGGKNVVDNLQTLCETCNRRKGNTIDRAAIAEFRGAL